MTTITFNAKYGLFLLIPLVLSLLFVGMSMITNASEDGPELNQKEHSPKSTTLALTVVDVGETDWNTKTGFL